MLCKVNKNFPTPGQPGFNGGGYVSERTLNFHEKKRLVRTEFYKVFKDYIKVRIRKDGEEYYVLDFIQWIKDKMAAPNMYAGEIVLDLYMLRPGVMWFGKEILEHDGTKASPLPPMEELLDPKKRVDREDETEKYARILEREWYEQSNMGSQEEESPEKEGDVESSEKKKTTKRRKKDTLKEVPGTDVGGTATGKEEKDEELGKDESLDEELDKLFGEDKNSSFEHYFDDPSKPFTRLKCRDLDSKPESLEFPDPACYEEYCRVELKRLLNRINNDAYAEKFGWSAEKHFSSLFNEYINIALKKLSGSYFDSSIGSGVCQGEVVKINKIMRSYDCAFSLKQEYVSSDLFSPYESALFQHLLLLDVHHFLFFLLFFPLLGFLVFFLISSFNSTFSRFLCFFFQGKSFSKIDYFRFFSSRIFNSVFYFFPVSICTLSSLFSFIGSIFFLIFQIFNSKAVSFTYSSRYLLLDSNFYFFQRLEFLIDPLSVVMLTIITFVSFIVHVYSLKYMEKDPNLPYFLSLLNLFTFFMILLVISGNCIQLLIGWEGVGISSYLLINFWCSRLEANKAALKAVLMNKIGDLGLLVIVVMSLFYFKTTSLPVLSLLVSSSDFCVTFLGNSIKIEYILCIALCIAAFAKSAQIGFHTWLPDAMEGPTPVSALLHAATMVTAGVYLLIRFCFFLELVPFCRTLIVLVGSLTALYGSLMALVQFDLKKIIAYSTTSQLGYMFVACGLSAYNVALYHLFTHAFFKAFLFLAAGVLIHNLNNEQDIRKMGSLSLFMPITFVFMSTGFLSLAGFPFFSGFYSKHAIFALAYNSNFTIGYYSFIICLFSSFLTCLYSARSIYYVFFNSPNFRSILIKTMNRRFFVDADTYYVVTLLPLFIGSIVIGYVSLDFFLSYSNPFLLSSLVSYNSRNFFFDFFFPWRWKFFLFVLPFIGMGGCFLFYANKQLRDRIDLIINDTFSSFYFFLCKRCFFDAIYNKVIVFGIMTLSELINTQVLRGYLEFFGPTGLVYVFKKIYLYLVTFYYSFKNSVGFIFLFLVIFIMFYLIKVIF